MTWWQKEPIIKGILAYEKVSDRERKILLVTVVLVLFIVFYMLLIEPIAMSGNAARTNYLLLTDSNALIEDKIEKTLESKYKDPNAEYVENLARLLEKEKLLDSQISALTQALVDPKKMIFILESALKEAKGIKLISLRNLPSENVYIDRPEINASGETITDLKNNTERTLETEEVDEENAGIIYKHALEIVVEASFKRMVQYLERLDGIEWKVFWQNLEYEVKEYPKGQLTIKIYTLSTSKEVLGV